MRARSLTPTSRRTVIKTAAASFGLAGTGLGAIALTARNARAAITTNDLQVASAEYRSQAGSVYTPWVYVSGEWSFEVGQTPAEWRVTLLVSPTGADDFEAIGQTGDGAISPSMASTYTVAGALVDHSAYSTGVFDAAPESSISHDVDVRVLLEVLDASGAVVVDAAAEDTFTVTVTNTSVAVSAGVAGDGQVLFQVEQSDPAPTPTPSP